MKYFSVWLKIAASSVLIAALLYALQKQLQWAWKTSVAVRVAIRLDSNETNESPILDNDVDLSSKTPEDPIRDSAHGSESYPVVSKGDELILGESMLVLPGNRTPMIFFWHNVIPRHTVFDFLPDSYYSDHEKLKCPNEARCLFSNLEEHMGTSDFAVIGFPQYVAHPKLPPTSYRRPRNQLWVFVTHEAPCHTYHWSWKDNLKSPKLLADFGDFFNLTMTYRLDSNITATYGRIERRKEPDFTRRHDRFSQKTKTAIFMSSYCGNRMSHRDEYVAELIKHGVDVEFIGSCEGKKSPLSNQAACIRTAEWSTQDDCSLMIGSMYKFYLSFENSFCKDYLTEKFYRAMMIDTIPVVMNAANMSQIAPPHSYIDAKDFVSPAALATYLKKVATDSTLYNSYFEWKPYYDVVHTLEGLTYKHNLCRLCAFAHKYLSNPKPSVISNIDKWWNEQGKCVEGPTSWPPFNY